MLHSTAPPQRERVTMATKTRRGKGTLKLAFPALFLVLLIRDTLRQSQANIRATTTTTTSARLFPDDPNITGTVPRRYEGFQQNLNCSSSERYRALLPDQHVKFVTAKFGYRNKFKKEVLERRQQAVDTFEWLSDDNAVGLYKVPDRWRHEFPNHTQFLDDREHASATGGGWWFWKSLVILEQLETLEDGDLLFYADHDQNTWWPAISDFLWFMVDHPEYDWALPRWIYGAEYENTKQDVFVAHCGSADIDERQIQKAFHSPQWEAGIHIVRNSPRTRQFARHWMTLGKNYQAISDDASYLPNHGGFEEHRRDQSLLNMIIKCFYRVGLFITHVPHRCGWLYDDNLIFFHFLKLPDKTDDDVNVLRNKTASHWDALRNGEQPIHSLSATVSL